MKRLKRMRLRPKDLEIANKRPKGWYRRFPVGAGGCGCHGPGVRHGDPDRPVLKYSPRSAGRATLMDQVKAWLVARIQQELRKNPDSGYVSFRKEVIAADLRTKESLVEIILRKLNQQGLVGQAVHDPDMDCHRSRWIGNGWSSMWNGDRYTVRDKLIDEVRNLGH